jgi:hypothetical protein
MPKIINIKLANTIAGISTEMVKFDESGVGEIKSPELYAEVLGLKNFFPFEGESLEDEKDEQNLLEVATKKLEKAKPIPQKVDPSKLSHDELDAIADELMIVVKGDKKSKAKDINDKIDKLNAKDKE